MNLQFSKFRIIDNEEIKAIQILDEEFKNTIKKTKLSASMIDSWLKSPGDYIFDKYIYPLITDEEPIYFTRGKWYHSIMESFYNLPQEERNKNSLKECIKNVTNKDKSYAKLAKEQENKDWLIKGINNYVLNWIENANNEKVAVLFINGKKQKGLELFVSGKLGKANRQVVGFIDKIIEGNTGLIIQDWKTGSKVSDFDPNKKISESNPFDYWRQQTLYALLLEQNNANIEQTSLIFPYSEPPQIVSVNHLLEDVRKQVIKDVEVVDKELTECIDNDFIFLFKKGKWNKWASYFCGLGNVKKPTFYEDKLLEYMEH